MQTDRHLGHSLGRGAVMAVVLLLAFGGGWLLNDFRLHEAASLHPPPPPMPKPSLPPRSNALLRTNAEPPEPPASLPESEDRVADARARHGEIVAAKFTAAGLVYPPKEIFLRVLKYEGQMELWGRNRVGIGVPFRLVCTYPIMRASGRLGPKRQEGDGQVPEGFYVIDRFNPRSLFHLSLGLDYPNASDRILAADLEHPGFDVFIHGGADSAGCMAMGDPAIEEIFLAALDAKVTGQAGIPVHIFPCRMDGRNWEKVLSPACEGNPALTGFWHGLQPAYDQFVQTHEVPLVRVGEDGSYAVSTSRQP